MQTPTEYDSDREIQDDESRLVAQGNKIIRWIDDNLFFYEDQQPYDKIGFICEHCNFNADVDELKRRVRIFKIIQSKPAGDEWTLEELQQFLIAINLQNIETKIRNAEALEHLNYFTDVGNMMQEAGIKPIDIETFYLAYTYACGGMNGER